MEGSYVEAGLVHLERLSDAGTAEHSPLVPLLAGIAARLCGGETNYARLDQYRFCIRLPFLAASLLLGASLWYVARRLYGNIGGYIALALYCFSPVIIASSQVDPADHRRMGGLRSHLHGHRSGAYALRSARSHCCGTGGASC